MNPPRGLQQTEPVPLPSPSGQHCGCHWRCSGHGGRGPDTVPVRRRVPPPDVVRALPRRAVAGSPVGCDLRGSRRWGAPGRAACGFSCVPPLGRRGPFWGRGGVPSAPGGQRAGVPAARRPGGERGRGGMPLRCSPPLSGLWPPPLSSFFSGAPPWGILVQSGLPGRCGRQARPDRPKVGQCGGRGEGRKAVISSPWSAPPPSPGRPHNGPLRLRLPGCRRSVVGPSG